MNEYAVEILVGDKWYPLVTGILVEEYAHSEARRYQESGGNDSYRVVKASTPPDLLSGDDGEVTFVRRDLAETPTAARAYALEHEGSNLSNIQPDEVEMLPVPDHFTEIEYEWAVVKPDTPAAVAYWRFRA